MRNLALLPLVVLCFVEPVPATQTFSPYGYAIVNLSPVVFPDVLGVRDLHQTGMILRIHPTVPPPSFVLVTTQQGLKVGLRVTSHGHIGNGLWSISTNHVQAFAPFDGPCRLVANTLAVDTDSLGAVGSFQ